MRDKHKLTTELIKQLPSNYNITIEAAMTTWWFNIRAGGGVRLTALGFKVLAEYLKLDHYTYAIPDNLSFTQHTILKLDRKLQHPYYITTMRKIPTHLVFFDSKEAMLLNLYGDLDKFLDNYV